jgi:hypothetical protein
MIFSAIHYDIEIHLSLFTVALIIIRVDAKIICYIDRVTIKEI